MVDLYLQGQPHDGVAEMSEFLFQGTCGERSAPTKGEYMTVSLGRDLGQ